MRIEFQARAANRRSFRHVNAAAAIFALLGAVLASGSRMFTAAFQLTPPALDFGAVRLGSASPIRYVELRNPDTKNLRIDSVGLAGADVAAFNLTWDACKDTIVPPQGTCRIGVFFQTSETRKQQATLSVASGPGGRRTVQLAGTGELPPTPLPTPIPTPAPIISLKLIPSSVQFGEVRVGSGADRVVTITNIGSAPAPVGQLQITGDHWNDFRIVDDPCSNRTLRSGYCQIRLSFIPAEAGQHQAVLAVPYTGGRSHATAWISGISTPPPAPIADLQPFRVELTRSDPEHSIELRDMGDGPLTALDISLGGKNPEDFTLDPRACAHATLERGQSCVMAVTFRPDIAKRERHKISAATVTVRDNAVGSPHTVEVIGTEGSTGHKRIFYAIVAATIGAASVYEATHGHGSDTPPPSNHPHAPSNNPTTNYPRRLQ